MYPKYTTNPRLIYHVCRQCRTGFFVWPSVADKGAGQFCSAGCYKVYQRSGNQSSDWVKRFWSRVEKRGPHECWPWMGGTSNGYGRFGHDNDVFYAHRVAFELAHGPLTDEECALHTCDYPLCCNPSHLFRGTRTTNAEDKVKKGRQCQGEAVHWAKLTEKQVQTIRSLYYEGHTDLSGLSAQFSVSCTTVKRIITGSTWRSIM